MQKLLWVVFVLFFALQLALGARAQDAQHEVVLEQSYIRDAGRSGIEIRLGLESKVPYRVFTMVAPPRLVIDAEGLSFAPLSAEFGQSADGVLGVRHGVFRPGWSRLVVDLAGYYTVEEVEIRGQGLELLLARSTAVEMETASHPPEDALGQDLLLTAVSPSEDMKPLIILDPGHGGDDPGAVSGRILEKDLVLEVALDLRQRILDTGRYRVIMTRESDVFIPLRERVEIARELGGDLFLSLHANAVETGYADGVEIFTLSNEASSEEASALMEFENRSDVVAGVTLEGEDDVITSTLIDLAQTDTNAQSGSFAGLLQSTLIDALKLNTEPRLMSAGFRVLRAPDIPSALLEMGFITNSVDRQYMQDPRWQRDFSRAVVSGLDHWFASEAERAAQFRR